MYPPIYSGAVVPSREGTTHDPSSPPSLGWPDKLPLSRSSHAAAGGCHDGAAAPRCPNPATGIDRPSGISSKNGSSPRSPSVLLGRSQHELAPDIDQSIEHQQNRRRHPRHTYNLRNNGRSCLITGDEILELAHDRRSQIDNRTPHGATISVPSVVPTPHSVPFAAIVPRTRRAPSRTRTPPSSLSCQGSSRTPVARCP